MLMTMIAGAVLAVTACSPLETAPDFEASDFPSEEIEVTPDEGDILEEILKTLTPDPVETTDSSTRELPADKQVLLNDLEVSEKHDDGKYEYPDTWKSASRYGVDAPQGNCTVRQAVLYRDGVDVKIKDNCQPYYGSWTDPYTGIQYGVGGAPGEPIDISKLHIEHVVAAKNAYESGAYKFTDETYLAFAHDVNNLLVSEGAGNSSKGHKGPEDWKPELESYHCEYASTWIDTKTDWELSVTQQEKNALEDMLSTC